MSEVDRNEPKAAGALGSAAMSGVVLLGAAQAAKFGSQLLSTIILARLLAPADFGLFAMVMPLVGFVMMFQDFGISQAVISARTITDEQLSSLFYINLGLSVALAAVFAASAPLIARFYGTTAVIGPVLALAGTIVISGLAALQFALLVRNLRFGVMALADIVGAVAGVGTGIVVALIHPSAWAMVASVVANMSAGVLCGWIASGWRPGRGSPFAEVKEVLTFGRGVISANFFSFVTRNADNILIARYIGTVPLGFYDRAYKLLLFPLQQIVSPLGRITVPIMARLIDQPQRYRGAYFRSLDQILMLGLPGMAVALVMADTLIYVMMGAKWLPAVPIFRWLGLVGLHLPLSQTLIWVLISQSRTRELSRLAAFEAVTSVLGFVIGLRYGVVGVAAIYAIGDYAIRLPLVFWVIGRKGPVSGGNVLRRLGPCALGTALGAGIVYLARPYVSLPPFFALVAATVVLYGITAGIVALFPSRRTVFREAMQIGGKAFGFLRRPPRRAAT